MSERVKTEQLSRETLDIAKKIVEVASDKQASDIVLLDARKVCSFADYFVILTGGSERQLEAIRQAIDERRFCRARIAKDIVHPFGHQALHKKTKLMNLPHIMAYYNYFNQRDSIMEDIFRTSDLFKGFDKNFLERYTHIKYYDVIRS